MATISENLLTLSEAKANIKSAIENKGQDLTDIPFTQYAEKINAIETAGVLQEKTVTPSTSVINVLPDEGYDGLGKVTVNAVDSSIDSNITPANIRAGVTVLGVQGNLEPDKPNQTKTVTPTTSQQVVTADTGYELGSVTINAVTSSIDADIVSGNIKKGVNILGVTGNYDLDSAVDDAVTTALNTEV